MPALRQLPRDQVIAFADSICKLRPHSAPRWDTQGVLAALAKVANLDGANVMMAALRLSQDRTARTPAQIAITTSQCWIERVSDWSPPTTHDICPTHGVTKNAIGLCASCRADQLGATHDIATPTRTGARNPDAIKAITTDLRARLHNHEEPTP